MPTSMLERVAKLLNQAENAGTEAEAAVFMEKAQQLATVYSIDLARARHATVEKERTVPVQRTIHIGERGSRGLRTVTDLYLGIAHANDISVTIAHDATRVYAVGFAEDIDISEALFASLQVQQASALDVFKRAGEWKGEQVYIEPSRSNEWYGSWKPQTWLTARLNFQDAYASRIAGRLSAAKWDEEARQRKLDEQRAMRPHLDDDSVPTSVFSLWLEQNHGVTVDSLDDEDSFGVEFCEMLRDDEDDWTRELVEEFKSAFASQSDGTELVLVEKRAAVAEAYAPMLKRARGSYRGGTSGASSSSGRAAGRSAADRASLGRGTSIGGTRGAINA